MSNFETKEEYLQFISAWKSSTNAEECKSRRVVCDHTQYKWDGFSKEETARLEELGYKVSKYSYTVPGGGHCKTGGWLNASHYIFRNMMLGKDPKRGFSPKMKRKLQYGETPWHGFVQGSYDLEYAITDAKRYVDQLGQGKTPTSGTRAKDFLEPFQGAVIIADLLKFDKEGLAEARKFHR